MPTKENKMPTKELEYIGDGTYVQYDGYTIWLTTEDGYNETNRVGLEPNVLKSLMDYVGRVGELIKRENEQEGEL